MDRLSRRSFQVDSEEVDGTGLRVMRRARYFGLGHFRSALVFILATVLSSGAGFGATLLSDSFDDGGITDGADPNDTDWFRNGAPGPLNDPVFSSGAMFVETTGNNPNAYGVWGAFAATSLASVGDQLELSFDVTVSSALSGSNDGFRFGLLNVKTGTTGALSFGSDSEPNGYFGAAAVDGNGSRNHGIFRQIDDDAPWIFRNSGDGFTELLDIPEAGFDPFTESTTHSYSLTLTRSGASSVDISIFDGTNTQSVTDSSVDVLTSFDAVAFTLPARGQTTDDNEFTLDNIVVTFSTAIPEPGAAWLLLAGLMGSYLFQRKRCRLA